MQETFLKLQEEHVVYGSFDLQFSGAGLAWNWFNAPDAAPWLIQAVEDRDLWKFHLADTKSVLAYVAAHDFDFETWRSFAVLLEYPANRRDFASRGNAILQYQNKLIRSAVKNKVIHKRIGEHSVPCLNLDYSMASEAGHIMAEHAPFAAIYNDEPKGRRYSLRSNKKGGVDVCAIAKQYGGGGHANAAGFFIPWSRIAEVEAGFAFNVLSGFGEK
jgi:nanoRNase/pAp phosphatase (c-di-AMP/oligoRNAs hydrolase)